MWVDVAGYHLPPAIHGDGGGKGLAAGGGAGVQHVHPLPGIGGQHRQLCGGILNVKEALPEGGQLLQAAGVGQQQAVGQPGVGRNLHPLRPEGIGHCFHRGFGGVHLGAGGRLPIVGGHQGGGLLPAQPAGKQVGQPPGMAVAHRRVLRRLQAVLLPHQGAEHPVDQTGGPGIFGALPGQIHRLTNGGVVGYPVKEKHLIGPKPQGIADRRLHLLQLYRGQLAQVVVQQQPVLEHPEAQPGGQGGVPAVQSSGTQNFFQKAVRPGALLFAGHQGPEGRFSGSHINPSGGC